MGKVRQYPWGEREKEEGGWRRGKERKRGKEGKGEGNLSGGISV